MLALLVVACGGGGSDGDATDVSTGTGLLIRWRETSSVAGYVIHWGTVSGSYDHMLDVGALEPGDDGLVSFLLEDGVTMGRIYFALTSYDEEYRMSAFSNELAADVP